LLHGSCKQKNGLAQNESVLISELVALENIPEIQDEKEQSGSYLGIPEESRLADPSHPVLVLDILKARSDVRELKTADLFSHLRYIPIKFNEPIDTFENRFGEFDFLITPNNIIASHFSYGITQFGLDGNFKNQIVKNDFYYTAVPGRNSVMVTFEDQNQFVGSQGQVHAIGDMIYYQYHNNPDGHGAMMQYNAAPGELTPTTVNLDDKTPNTPKGRELYDLATTHHKQGASSSISANSIFPINEDEWASSYSKMRSSQSESFMISTNLQGDTLTKFKDYDPIRDFTGSVYRGLDGSGSQYQFQGISHVRQGYNDTIYMVASSNKLIPKYVLDFGAKGIQSSTEGMDPGFDLKEKFVIDQLVETNRYLFITYTKDYPCPNTAKSGTLRYSACIYDKDRAELFHIYLDRPPHIGEGLSWPEPPKEYIQNNLDSGPVFWPKSTTYDGKPFTWFKKQDIPPQMNLQHSEDIDYLLMIVY
jgi:hypothetical protein